MFYILLYFITIIYKLFPSHKKVNRCHEPLQSYFSVLFVDSISSILTDSASDSAEKELSSVEDRGLISQKAFSNRT